MPLPGKEFISIGNFKGRSDVMVKKYLPLTSSTLKFITLIVLMLHSIPESSAQLTLHSYVESGKNNVSEGHFLKNGYRGIFQHHHFNVEAGMQLDVISTNPNRLSGLDLIGSSTVLIWQNPLIVKGFFMLNRFSDILYETNWGVRMETRKLNHFSFELGTNFKTYAYNSKGRNQFNIPPEDRTLQEHFNLIYGLSAFLKPHTNDWNLSLTVTNIDYYVISQSTNPLLKITTIFKPVSHLALYVDAWYKQAGVFNISATHFGYFLRGGVIWDI